MIGCSIDVDEIRDIVIGLFRLAGIEEDDDLITVCVSDIRSGDKIASIYAFSNGLQFSPDFVRFDQLR